MKSIKLAICHKCYCNILSRKIFGRLQLHRYIDICERYSTNLSVFINAHKHGQGDILVHFLEKDRYIVTTELNKDCLMVRPLGHDELYDIEEGIIHSFCAFRSEHIDQ